MTYRNIMSFINFCLMVIKVVLLINVVVIINFTFLELTFLEFNFLEKLIKKLDSF